MPRMGRVVVEGYPHHVVQRGHNRQVVFVPPRPLSTRVKTQV